MPTWAVDIIAGTGAFDAAVKKIPGTVGGAAKNAEKEARAATAGIGREVGKAAADIGKAGKLAFPAMGELGEKLNAAVQGFGALGPAGLAVGAGIGIAAVATAAVSAAAGIVKLTDAAHGYIEEIEKLQAAGVVLVSDDQIARVEAAHAALEGVRLAGKAAAVIFASEFGPAVERVATDALALMLVLRDSQEEIREGAAAVLSWVDAAADMGRVVGPMLSLVPGMGSLGTAAQAGAAAWDALGGAAKLAGLSLDYVEKQIPDYLAEAKEMIASVHDLGEKHSKAARGAKEQDTAERDLAAAYKIGQAAVSDLLSPQAKLLAGYEEQKAKLLDLMDLHGDESAAGIAAADALLAANARYWRDVQDMRDKDADAAQATREKELAAAQALAEKEAALIAGYEAARLSSAQSLFGSLIDLQGSYLQAAGATERKVWAWQQAGAYSQALINAALGISEAAASAPWPYNMIPIAAQAAQGVAHVAAIAAVPAPQAYAGYDVPYASPMGSPVVVHPGESVRTRSETERDRAPGITHVETWIGGRRVADTVASEARRGGAVSAELTRRTGRMGHSAPFRSI